MMCRHLQAACLLAVALVGLAGAQTDLFETNYAFSTGEQLEFLKGSASFKYFPFKSANCTKCFVSFKLGALSELDAFGQPIAAHVIPSLSELTPSVTTGKRISGDTEYQYVTMTFSGAGLGPGMSKEACPTLESILTRASQMGIQAPEGSLMANVGGLSSLSPARSAPVLSDQSDLIARDLAVTSPGASALRSGLMRPDDLVLAGRRLSQTAGPGITPSVEVRSGARIYAAATTPTSPQTMAQKPVAAVQPARMPVMVAAPAPEPTPVSSFNPESSTASSRLSAPVPQPRLLDHNADAAASLKVTFMFGFTQNKTFPYGVGRFVSAPKGGVKWSLEAANWPFCSLYNTLKLELVAISSIKENEAQFTLDGSTDPNSDEESVSPEAMIDSVFGSASTRRLQGAQQFGGYGVGFFEPEAAKPQAAFNRAAGGLPLALTGFPGLAGLSGLTAASSFTGLPAYSLPAGLDPLAALSMLNPRRKLASTIKRAKLLVGAGLAATMELPGYSFASNNFTGEANVSIVLASNSSDGAARFSLTFGYFPTGLYYDAIMYFSDTFDMQLAAADTSALPAPGSSILAAGGCQPGEEKCSRGRRTRGATSNAASATLGHIVKLLGPFLAVLLLVF